ncbi:hypothetical protein [Nonomuraea rosea]|uniref:hypothetical protein n=1 Tax=Nonomuraea rosea TaxID=638574 RepID=UPI0031EF1A9D
MYSSTVAAGPAGSMPACSASSAIESAWKRETPGASYSAARSRGVVFASKSWKARAPG